MTAPALVGAFAVVPSHEGIEVGLYLFKVLVELLVEVDLVELLLHRLVSLSIHPLAVDAGASFLYARLRSGAERARRSACRCAHNTRGRS